MRQTNSLAKQRTSNTRHGPRAPTLLLYRPTFSLTCRYEQTVPHAFCAISMDHPKVRGSSAKTNATGVVVKVKTTKTFFSQIYLILIFTYSKPHHYKYFYTTRCAIFYTLDTIGPTCKHVPLKINHIYETWHTCVLRFIARNSFFIE